LSTQASKTPTLAPQTVEQRAFVALIRAHVATTRRLSAGLETGHGLSLSDYEVLLRLAGAPDRMMRRVDLARSVLLTPSGITRLLEGLERSGYVERVKCETDARVTYAHLTDEGHAKLREASKSHIEEIRDHFSGFSDDELEALHALLSRLEVEPFEETACSPS
jgi:DNA-binding MarR family transcriptional regulator